MTTLIGRDGIYVLDGAHVKTLVFKTDAAGVRSIAFDCAATREDFLHWMDMGDDIRAQILGETAEAASKVYTLKTRRRRTPG